MSCKIYWQTFRLSRVLNVLPRRIGNVYISLYTCVLFPLTVVIYGERPRLSPNIVNVNFFLVDFSAKQPPKSVFVPLYSFSLFVFTCILYILWYIFLLDTFYIDKPIGIVVLGFVYIVLFVSLAVLIKSMRLFFLL